MTSAPTPPKPATPSTDPLGPFVRLKGGERQEIAPGGQLVTLHGASATWWVGDEPISAPLPNIPVHGAQWSSAGKLHVGLGALDLAAKTWTGDARFSKFAMRGPRGEIPVREVSWFRDTQHAALLLESRDRTGKVSTEVVIVAPDGSARGRRTIPNASYLVASDDRVLVGGGAVVMLDLDAKVVADVPTPPRSFSAKEADGVFAILASNHQVVLVRGADGSVLATWDIDATDAAPIARGVIATDAQGEVSVACLDGSNLRVVTKVSSGGPGSVIRQVGDRVVVIGGTSDPVRVASFTNPCAPSSH